MQSNITLKISYINFKKFNMTNKNERIKYILLPSIDKNNLSQSSSINDIGKNKGTKQQGRVIASS